MASPGKGEPASTSLPGSPSSSCRYTFLHPSFRSTRLKRALGSAQTIFIRLLRVLRLPHRVVAALFPLLHFHHLPPSPASPRPPIPDAMAAQATDKCWVCGKPSAMRCSACGEAGIDILFCSREHQKLVRPPPPSRSSSPRAHSDHLLRSSGPSIDAFVALNKQTPSTGRHSRRRKRHLRSSCWTRSGSLRRRGTTVGGRSLIKEWATNFTCGTSRFVFSLSLFPVFLPC